MVCLKIGQVIRTDELLAEVSSNKMELFTFQRHTQPLALPAKVGSQCNIMLKALFILS